MRTLTTAALLFLFSIPVRADQKAPTEPPVYDESANGTADVGAALQRAARDNKRILLDLGGNWCPWCHKLHNLFTTDDNVARVLKWEYEVVNVDVGHGEKNRELLAKYGIEIHGFPYLAVLGADDHLVCQQETGYFENGPGYVPQRFVDFFNKWKAAPLDATKVLTAALSQAQAEHKRVFLRIGAPWCSWCRRLDSVVHQPAIESALQSDFVMVTIDIERMTGGKELQQRYQTSHGTPWFAILTPDGRTVSTSDMKPGENLAFPTDPQQLDHMMKMLSDSRQHMTDRQLSQIRKAFIDAVRPTTASDVKRQAD
jgi:thioredoxin-related protein